MKKADLIALFPATVQVTKEMLTNVRTMNVRDCIGARAVKTVLPEEHKDQISWGVTDGGFYKKGAKVREQKNCIFTIQARDEKGELVNMMRIEKPQTVIFNIK